MFFIMRADIIPRYEDNLNINGGCLSFKISLEDFENKFFELCANIIGENIGINDDVSNNINGVVPLVAAFEDASLPPGVETLAELLDIK